MLYLLVSLNWIYMLELDCLRHCMSKQSKNKSSVGPRIEPWGTPDNSSKNSDIPSTLFID